MKDIPYLKFGFGYKNLVVIPGLSLKPITPSKAFIEAKFEMFKTDYTIYLFDRLENPPEGYSIFDMAKDTLEAMHELGIKKTDLYGTSQGGMIALAITLLEPDMINKLALASTYARGNEYSEKTFKNWISLAEQKNEKELIESTIEHVYSESFQKKYHAPLVYGMKGLTDKEFRKFVILGKSLLTFDVYEQLKDIHKPMFVAATENDKVLLADGSKEIASICGAKFELYDNSYGHALYDEDPNFLSKLFDFLKK